MTLEKWLKVLEKMLKSAEDTLSAKGEEYATDKDRFHNFRVAGRLNQQEPENAAWFMATKHLVAILDILSKVERREAITKDDLPRIQEVFGDLRNYLFLIEGMLTERTAPPVSPTP